MSFVDITIVPVSRAAKDQYVTFSRRMAEVYRDHGATRIVDHWQTDDPIDQGDFHSEALSYDEQDLPDFADVIGATSTESVVVSVTEWPSRDARDRGTAAAIADPRVLATLDEDAVFSGGRVMAASFEITMDLKAE